MYVSRSMMVRSRNVYTSSDSFTVQNNFTLIHVLLLRWEFLPWKFNNVFPLCRRPTDVPVNNINIERVTMEAQQCVLSSTVVKLEYFIMLTPLQLSFPDEDSDVMAISRRWQQRQYLDFHVHARNSWPIWNKLEFSR